MYCINPCCKNRVNSPLDSKCQSCGSTLVIAGRYRLLRLLKENKFGHSEIFEIEDLDKSLEGQWVLKVLKTNEPHKEEILLREFNFLKYFAGPGIPKTSEGGFFTCHDSVLRKDYFCLLMEKIPGQTLSEVIEQKGPQPYSLVLDWLDQLLVLLERVHNENCFHRDIKSDNIVLTPSGEIFLIDWGAAREVSGTYLAKLGVGRQSEPNQFEDLRITSVISAGFTPLEQIWCRAVPQSDFYSLGMTLIYALTGVHPTKLPQEDGKIIWKNYTTAPRTLQRFLNWLVHPKVSKRPRTVLEILEARQNFRKNQKLHMLWLVNCLFGIGSHSAEFKT
jgi:serine/threonine protein kinase